MREKRGALLLLVLAAGLLWGSSRLTWVRATLSDDLRGTRVQDLTGAQWASGLAPLALAALAAVAAVLAVRGWALRAVAALLLVVGVAAAWPGVQLWTGGATGGRAAALLDSGSSRVGTEAVPLAALPAVAGAVVLVVSGVLLLRAPVRAGGLSERYQTPAVRRERASRRATAQHGGQVGPSGAEPDTELAQREIWDALDAGVDPTDEPTVEPDPAGDPPGDPGHGPSTLAPGSSTDRGEGGPRP